MTIDEDFWKNHSHVRIRGRSRVSTEPSDVLLDSRIYMGAIQSQDDIYEGHLAFEEAVRPTREALVELARKQMRGASYAAIEHEVDHQLRRIADDNTFAQMRSAATNQFDDLYSRSSILSFFPTVFDQRNWAQYGEAGSGHAFVFDFRHPWPMSCAPGMSVIEAVPFEVAYVAAAEIPKIPVVFGPHGTEEGWRDIQLALLTKSDRWAEQTEERLIRMGIPAGYVHFPPQSLTAVVLGYHSPEEDERHIVELCRTREVPLPVFRLVANRKERQLELRQIS